MKLFSLHSSFSFFIPSAAAALEKCYLHSKFDDFILQGEERRATHSFVEGNQLPSLNIVICFFISFLRSFLEELETSLYFSGVEFPFLIPFSEMCYKKEGRSIRYFLWSKRRNMKKEMTRQMTIPILPFPLSLSLSISLVIPIIF